MHMLIKVHIIVQDKELMSYDIFSYFFLYNIGICTKSITNTFVRYYLPHLIKHFDYALRNILSKSCKSYNCLKNI